MRYGLIAVAIFLVAVVGGVITFFILRNSNNKLRQEAVDKFFKLIGEQQKLDTKEINTFNADGVLTEKDLTSIDDRRKIIAAVCDSFRDELNPDGTYKGGVENSKYLSQFCKQYNDLFVISLTNTTDDRDTIINDKTEEIDGLSRGFGTMLRDYIYTNNGTNLDVKTPRSTHYTNTQLELAIKADDAVTKYNRRQQLIARIGTQSLTAAQNIQKVYETGSILEIHSTLKESIATFDKLITDIQNQTPGQPFA